MVELGKSGSCRSCGARALDVLLDFGLQPDPDELLPVESPDPAPEAAVVLGICSICGLVQLLGPRPEGPRPPHGHARPASADDPWVGMIERSLEANRPVVLDVDGSSGISEASLAPPSRVIAGQAEGDWDRADVILVGHAFAHADDLDGLVGRIASALAPRGLIVVDFHHALGLADGQFDVVAHTHRSYLSLQSLECAFDRHDLTVVVAARIADYGGTVRVVAARRSDDVTWKGSGSGADEIRQAERTARIDRRAGYAALDQRMRVVCEELFAFLDTARREGRMVAGYGAASRGITLLNLAGIGVDGLPFVVDRSPAKQGRLLPRSRIPVLAPSELETASADDVLILPWPLAGAISDQLSSTRSRGARLHVAMPRLKLVR